MDPIPEQFSSAEEAAAFWDTHNTTDYPDAFQTITVEEAEFKQRHYEVEIDPDLVDSLQEYARQRGISVRRLISSLLRQQLRPAA